MINFKNIKTILKNIDVYNKNAKLLIVTKKQTVEDIKSLIVEHYNLFGENRVQEAKQKYSELRQKFNFNLHLIGHLQTNKTHDALRLFDCIQSLDRKNLVDEIVKHLHKPKIMTKKFYIEINLGDEKQKSGIPIAELKNFYDYCIIKKLHIEGLMCIPPIGEPPSFYFEKLRALRDNLNTKLKLSMGMSADYIDALKNQSDLIRVGSIIFS